MKSYFLLVPFYREREPAKFGHAPDLGSQSVGAVPCRVAAGRLSLV